MPTRRRTSLRWRVTFVLAGFGAAVSLLLAVALYLSVHDSGEWLMDEALRAEMADYMARRARNPHALPPATLSLRGYVASFAEPNYDVPEALRALPRDEHEIQLGEGRYRVAVLERNGVRYFMLFNEAQQRAREQHLLAYLAGSVLVMTLVTAVGGFWLAGRVIAPVTELARQVASAEPGQPPQLIAADASDDEVGELARVFDRYLQRLGAFMDRERAFTADVSHELRTPLAVIQGAVEVLQVDGALSESQRARLGRIERAAADMAELIRALLLMAREEADDTRAEEQCDAAAVLRECVEKHRHLAKGRGTQIELEIASSPNLPAEPTLLAVVVGNLIRNAFAYTESGRVSIRLEAQRLTVADTGIGIRSEDLGRVFQRYYKGSASHGSGIGLSLVKRICDRYGWEIAIESREGEGTSARLVFDPTSG
jgi:signal transduction histidine kinase